MSPAEKENKEMEQSESSEREEETHIVHQVENEVKTGDENHNKAKASNENAHLRLKKLTLSFLCNSFAALQLSATKTFHQTKV